MKKMCKKYRHYNSKGCDYKKFRPEKFVPIDSCTFWTKPRPGTGFWASPVDADYGWNDWCKDNMPEWIEGAEYFDFELQPDVNVLCLYTRDDLTGLMIDHPEWVVDSMGTAQEILMGDNSMVYLDFKRMLEDGVDAVEIIIDELYFPLYGWDCDSILIMNPDVVEGRR